MDDGLICGGYYIGEYDVSVGTILNALVERFPSEDVVESQNWIEFEIYQNEPFKSSRIGATYRIPAPAKNVSIYAMEIRDQLKNQPLI